MSKTKLKPCPFCGGRGSDLKIEYEGSIPYLNGCEDQALKFIYFVYCKSCESRGPAGNNANVVIETWNKRCLALDTAEEQRERLNRRFAGREVKKNYSADFDICPDTID